MKKQIQKTAITIRFRRWSRKGYAIFRSLGNTVTIGRLTSLASTHSLLKSELATISNYFAINTGDDNASDETVDVGPIPAQTMDMFIISQMNEHIAAACGSALHVYSNYHYSGCNRLSLFQPLFYLHYNMKKFCILSAMLLVTAFAGALHAQSSNDSVAINLNQVSVNARRTQLYSQLGRVVTIIEKDEIKRSAVQSIDQLLDLVPGIDVRQRGTGTTQADISVRGGTFDQILILLNGVSVTDPQTGHLNLDLPINISDVSRVEILQGSAARVLGPNAFSGAINIVTEKGAGKSLQAELNGGSFQTFGQSVSGSTGTDKFNTFASVSHSSSDGYRYNTDYEMTNAFIQSALQTSHAGKINLQLGGQLKDMGINGFYGLPYPDQREANKVIFTSADWSLSKSNFDLNAQVSWRGHYDRYEFIHNVPQGYKYHITDVVNAKLSGSYSSNFGKTTLGFTTRNEHLLSTSMGNSLGADSIQNPFDKSIYFKYKYNRTIFTGMIDHSVKIGQWYISAGISGSYSNDFKTTTYGGVDLGYFLTNTVKLYVSANTATRLPTFTDLFFVNPIQIGDPNLKPEISKTLEAGTKINKTNWNLSADVYYRFGKNTIDWVRPSSTATAFHAMNLAELNTYGWDLALTHYFHETFIKKISTTYSYVNENKSSEGYVSKYALDYLKNKVTFAIDHSVLKNVSARWTAAYNERYGNYDANLKPGGSVLLTAYNPYFMLDLRLMWQVKKLEVFADANNLLNQNYADFGGLTQPGINFNVGLRLKL